MKKRKIVLALFILFMCTSAVCAGPVTLYDYFTSPVLKSETVKLISKKESKKENNGNIKLFAGYFMPLSETWADAVLPVVSANCTITTPGVLFGNSRNNFSLSVRAGYSYLREKGVNSYRDNRFYLSMPFNFEIFLFENQSLSLGAGPYLGLSYFLEKSVYSESWEKDLESRFGAEAFIRFNYELSPSFMFSLEFNSLLGVINHDFTSLGLNAGIGYRF